MEICPSSEVYLNRTYEEIRLEVSAQEEIGCFLEKYFKRPCILTLFPMKGGHSDAKNYFLEIDGTAYVLRLENPNASLQHNQRELFAFQEASKLGIAPTIYAISSNYAYALIEYINLPTLSIAQAKAHIKEAGEMLSVLHSLPKNPFPRKRLLDQFLSIYEELKQNNLPLSELDEAIKEAIILDEAILSFEAPSVTIHGDLHPRNIFYKDKFIVVDWEGTSWDDPFYDLTFFANLNNYTEDEEIQLLEHYLKRVPNREEIKRYFLCRRLNLIFLGLTCLYQAHFSSLEENVTLKSSPLSREWSYYIFQWAEKGEHPAQFFFDWGTKALKKAQMQSI
jgi:thiamine kinase-like enzyme